MRGTLFTACSAAAVVTCAMAQPPCHVEELARVGGEFAVVSGDGDIALINAGTRLLMLDVSDPSQPTVISETQIVGSVWTHRMSGHTALVVVGDEVRVYDVSDPTNPMQVGAVTPRPGIVTLDRPALDGSTAYLLYGGAVTSVVAVDISDPFKPEVLGSIEIGGSQLPWSISAEGGVVAASLYVQNADNLVWFIDARDPRNLTTASIVQSSRYAGNLATNGSYTYVFNWYDIDIYDSSDPYHPQIVGRVRPWAWATGYLELSGTTLFATKADDPGGGTVFAYDVSNPAEPISIGSIRTFDPAWSIAAIGDRALVLADAALRVVSGNPISFSGELASEGRASSAVFSNGLLHVGSTSGLHVYDVTDPSSPFKTGESLVFLRTAPQLALNGDLVYFKFHSELRIYDTSSGAPLMVGSIALPCTGHFDADGPMIISGCSVNFSSSVVIGDLSDPTQPLFSQSMSFPQSPRAVAISDGVALVSSDALHVLDVSDPLSPHVITTLPMRPLSLELKDAWRTPASRSARSRFWTCAIRPIPGRSARSRGKAAATVTCSCAEHVCTTRCTPIQRV